jgi:DNA-binding protein Fis
LHARGESKASAEGLTDDVDEQLLRGAICRHLDKRAGKGAHEQLLSQVERLAIAEALTRTGGNQAQAALLLGLPRPTLHAKIQRFGIRNQR